ncbi:hypothetical protein LTR66_014977 [Elasticomyces elasticus]|nr:hypothetical protein LTR66_014977 [Elasticomyces elasticus]
MLATPVHAILPRQSSESSTDEFLNLIANPFQSQISSTAFFASLATSLGGAALAAVAFSLLRPYNNVVYAPRQKHADSKHAPPPIGKGMLDWVQPVLKTKEEQMVEKVGLDATLFLRFTSMCRDIFLACSVVGCGILIPVNLVSGHGTYSQWSDISVFSKLGPEYMYGSSAFWAYVVCAYVFDLIICYFLWWNYKAVTRLRRAYFENPEYQSSLHARTLLVTDIPKELRTDEGIVRIVDEAKSTGDDPRAAIARNVKDLPELVDEHEDTVRSLESVLAKYLKNPNRLPAKRPVCKVKKDAHPYRKGEKVDAIEYLTARIKELEIEIKEVRESVDKRNAMPYGFASYESITEAHSVAYAARNKTLRGSTVRLAPKPHDLIWNNLPMTKEQRRWQTFVNNFWVGVLTLVWIVPNVLISVFLSNLSHLGQVWPAFQSQLLAHKTWWGIVQGVVSPAITSAFYLFLPVIFRRLCVKAGDVTKTSRERHVMHKLYTFFTFNNLFVFSLFSAVWSFVAAVVHTSKTDESVWQAIMEKKIFLQIMLGLCSVSTFWITFQLQRTLGAAVDLSQLVNLAWGSFSRHFLSPTPRQLIELSAPPPFDYAGYYNYFLFYSTIGICFATLQPLILPVTAFYFALDHYMKKYLILYVFVTKTESGGQFWRVLYNRFIFLALLGNAVIALIVGAQGSSWGMLGALAPCPFIMLAFKWYCARTFDDPVRYYATALRNDAESAFGGEAKARHGDRVGVRFGHPVLCKPLMTPMVHAKSQHLLKQIYHGRTSVDLHAAASAAAGHSDVHLDPMKHNRPGKPAAGPPAPGAAAPPRAPFEIVPENRLDFGHYKDRPEFAGENGGDGELYGRAADVVRPGTPASAMRRDGGAHRARSASSHSSSSSDSRTRGAGDGTTYPPGYHRTPSALRELSPADAGLLRGAARMGRSPSPGGFGPVPLAASEETPMEEPVGRGYLGRGRRV